MPSGSAEGGPKKKETVRCCYVATLVLTEAQRQLLKRPLGELVSGTTAECNRVLREVVAKEKPVRLILVGDAVARNASQMGMMPDVMIIDNREKRRKANPFSYTAKHVLRTRNLPGTIESGAWEVVEEAIRKGNSAVIVEGEEDLLALVAALSSPDGSLVVYGQPGEGIVLVRVSATEKRKISKVVEGMERRG
jgi:uncharacterized protein (UPF0218 family)